MKKNLLKLGMIGILPLLVTNINQISINPKPSLSNQVLQKNVDNFQKISNTQYVTTDKVAAYSQEELYLINTNNHQKIDLQIKGLSSSVWSIGNNRFIASDGAGTTYIYVISNSKIISKTPINFLKGAGIYYSQKITNNIYLVSFPDQNFHTYTAIVDFSNINQLKYQIIPNNPFISNGNPAYVINNHSFIISVTAKSDWLFCDFSDFNHPVYYPFFNSPYMVFSSINVLSPQQMLITMVNTKNDTSVTQLWTINNKNPNLWIKQTIKNIVIKDFITIKSHLAVISIENKSGLFLLDYTNWNNLKISAIPHSQNIEMLDEISLYPLIDLIFMNNQIIFNDFNSNQLKILNFNYLNNITFTTLPLSLASYFSGFYQLSKINDEQFFIIDNNQNLVLVTL